MKILSVQDMRELDAFTIQHEPIEPIALMERAATAVAREISRRWPASTHVTVFAGPGNNGGDALAVARLLAIDGYTVKIYLFNTGSHISPDCQTNKERLADVSGVDMQEITSQFEAPRLTADDLVVDGLFGTGLNKPLSGGYALLAKLINASPAQVVAIDIPSGLMCEDNSFNTRSHIIRATLTLTFQLPKLAMLLPDCHEFVGELQVLDIGLSAAKIAATATCYAITEEAEMRATLRPRDAFGHKGTFGHAVIMAGRYGMAGAAVLACRACLRSGCGKVTLHTPARNNDIVQTSVPEVILEADPNEYFISTSTDVPDYDALAIGPGIGTEQATGLAFIEQVLHSQAPVVIDADALNILADHKGWIQQIPAGSILTPHPGEFRRIGNHCTDSYSQLTEARELAAHQKIYVVLKGHFTAICTPEGNVWFNPTGNSGMATAGSGDVLTGIITSLLAQGYSSGEAARLGVYLHGLAGDFAAERIGEDSLTASDIIQFLPKAFRHMRHPHR